MSANTRKAIGSRKCQPDLNTSLSGGASGTSTGQASKQSPQPVQSSRYTCSEYLVSGKPLALMGADFHADGYERNKATIEVFAEQAHLVGIVGRRISAEEYFAEYLEG